MRCLLSRWLEPASPEPLGAGLGQFALDEKDGDLRVVTTEDGWWTSQSVNHLFVLQAEEGKLAVMGDAGALAPGETVQSARFVGDTGYVVTFRQVDPLFVIAAPEEVPEYCYTDEWMDIEPVGTGAAGGIADPAIDMVGTPVATGGTGGAGSTTDSENDPACPATAPEDGAECEVAGLNNCNYTLTSCLCTTPASPDIIPEWYCWETATTDTDTGDSAAAGGASGSA